MSEGTLPFSFTVEAVERLRAALRGDDQAAALDAAQTVLDVLDAFHATVPLEHPHRAPPSVKRDQAQACELRQGRHALPVSPRPSRPPRPRRRNG